MRKPTKKKVVSRRKRTYRDPTDPRFGVEDLGEILFQHGHNIAELALRKSVESATNRGQGFLKS